MLWAIKKAYQTTLLPGFQLTFTPLEFDLSLRSRKWKKDVRNRQGGSWPNLTRKATIISKGPRQKNFMALLLSWWVMRCGFFGLTCPFSNMMNSRSWRMSFIAEEVFQRVLEGKPNGGIKWKGTLWSVTLLKFKMSRRFRRQLPSLEVGTSYECEEKSHRVRNAKNDQPGRPTIL